MSKVETKKIVKKYIKKLKEEKFPFSAIYLYGSYAKGNAKEESDIDIAVISDALKKNWNENEEKLWKYTVDIDSRIEPIGLTPEEFENNTNPLVFEIRNFGVQVK